ncbi:hypothetical protein VTO42DRAFT_1681 [Malbranchea cinnamomea]
MTQKAAPTFPYRTTLTFGLEVTLFAALKGITFSRIPHESISHLLAERLRQHRLSGTHGTGSKIKALLTYPEYDINPEPPDYSGWTLISTPSAAPDHPEWFEEYQTESIEIISPPYWISSSHWEHDLQRIFSLRSGQYNVIPARELRLYCEQNNNTTIHVHIGNGLDPNSGFNFHTVRNLAMILFVYEPLLDRLLDGCLYPTLPIHPPRAITPVNNPHFLPPDLQPKASRALLALHLFRTCPDMISLINAMNPVLPDMVDEYGPRYFKFNFIPLLDSVDGSNPYYPSENLDVGPVTPKRKPPTIEFRQHIGTLDPDTMIHWVKFLAAIVELAGKLTSETIIEFLGLEDWVVRPCEENDGSPPANGRCRLQYIQPPPSSSPRSLSAFSLLSTLHPVGSFARLATAMESAHVPLDQETARFWRRKA